MYECENWTIKKAEPWRTDASELWWCRRPLDCKEIQPINHKGNKSWIFIGRTDAEAETLILWPPDGKNQLIGKDSDAGRDLGAGGEGDDRGWDGWMASLTWWTWVWVNSGSWWWTGRPGMLQFMGSQRVGHNWETLFPWAITVDGDCSHNIKRHLLLRRKAMTNLDSILKSRDIPLPTRSV